MVQKGDYVEALRYGMSIEPEYVEDHDFLFIMGSIHYIMEEPRGAIQYLDRAVSLRPDDVEALMLMTNAHLSLKQRQEAASCCMHILKIDPGHTEAKALLGDLQD
jgi:tetratricopeptide (TPR) repeat protein